MRLFTFVFLFFLPVPVHCQEESYNWSTGMEAVITLINTPDIADEISLTQEQKTRLKETHSRLTDGQRVKQEKLRNELDLTNPESDKEYIRLLGIMARDFYQDMGRKSRVFCFLLRSTDSSNCRFGHP